MEWSEPIASVAKSLFGRSLRVILAAWILDRNEPFFLQEAQDAMRAYGEAPSGVGQELRKFVRHGMLSELPANRRIYFVRVESPLWEAFSAISSAVRVLHSAESRADDHT